MKVVAGGEEGCRHIFGNAGPCAIRRGYAVAALTALTLTTTASLDLPLPHWSRTNQRALSGLAATPTW